jgi:hypothetical protein
MPVQDKKGKWKKATQKFSSEKKKHAESWLEEDLWGS